MTRRVVIGKRGNGDTGVFVSPAGVDAYSAADASLLLNVVSKVSQLILSGNVSSTQLISLGLGQQPIVLLTTYYNASLIVGVTSNGPFRPSPFQPGLTAGNVAINGSGISMTITTSVQTGFAVYSKAF